MNSKINQDSSISKLENIFNNLEDLEKIVSLLENDIKFKKDVMKKDMDELDEMIYKYKCFEENCKKKIRK